MLQSVEPPAGEHPPLSAHSETQQQSSRPSLWQWVSFKELTFVFVVCGFGVLLFRTKDAIQLAPAWREALDKTHYSNSKFPVDGQKMPSPLVTDLDSDGHTDMTLLTYNNHLKLLSFSAVSDSSRPLSTKQTFGEVEDVDLGQLVSEGVWPVAMASGYLQQYQSMLQIRHQVVVVLMSDWTTLCFDHTLKLLWKTNTVKKKDTTDPHTILEGSILVSAVGIHKGDYGSIVIGGRPVDAQELGASMNRIKKSMNAKDESELVKSLDHYTMYALEGRGGELRWQHTPQDFQITPAYSTEDSPFHHLKLTMFRHEQQHYGEVSWHQYSTVMRSTLPHSWQDNTDTHFTLAHFKKDKKRGEKSEITDHISKVGDMAMGHIAGLAFGGQQPHTSNEHVENPNVIVLHSIKGVEVIHLFQGRPLCSLPLSPYHSTHLDVNGDGVIDHITAVVNPGEDFSEEDCYGMATPMNAAAKPIFKHSICKATHWTESFVAIDEWFPQINKAGRKTTKNALTEALAPVMIPSSYHSAPLKLHVGGAGWDFRGIFNKLIGSPSYFPPVSSTLSSAAEQLYDSIFVLSSGRVTSIGPHGEFNWQMDSSADWDAASHIMYDPSHESWNLDPDKVQFISDSFTPSATPFSPQTHGKKDHIAIMGWEVLTILSGDDGVPVATVRLDCNPVAPILVTDFSGDGLNDIIITCPDKYMGISLTKKSGFWQTTLLGVLMGIVLVVFAVYTRQRTMGLLPPLKPAQD